MSVFKVTIEEVESVKPHPNADRLELIKMKGMNWQCVVRKDYYKIGDFVIYFPVDSIIPNKILSDIGLEGKLSGPSKNRVKTIKLRGEISQGLVADPFIVLGFGYQTTQRKVGEDITNELGVVKYEVPEIICHAGRLNPLPDGVSIYDIEGADNYPEIVEYLMDKLVVITEKLEGTNFSVTLDHENKFWVNQRKHTIIPTAEKEHLFWKIAKKYDLETLLSKMKYNYNYSNNKNVNSITLRGELIGPTIQKNIYALNEQQVFFFDNLVDGRYTDAFHLKLFYETHNLQTCPILSDNVTLREWLDGKTVQEASNGISKLFNTPREGIVIKPKIEEWHPKLGRLIIKQRSPEYLAKSEF